MWGSKLVLQTGLSGCNVFLKLAVIYGVIATAGCAELVQSSHQKTRVEGSALGVSTPIEEPVFKQNVSLIETPNVSKPEPVRKEIFRGTGMLFAANGQALAGAQNSADEDITLNFVKADIRDVAQTVLGDFLGVPYVIGDKVKGTVSISTAQPIKGHMVLPVLEQAIEAAGFALVETQGVYQVISLADARKSGLQVKYSGGRDVPGHAIEIFPIRYIGAGEMAKLLEPIVPPKTIAAVDKDRNILLISGSRAQRALVRENIELFDVDWMQGMSFALFYPKYVGVSDLQSELEIILGGKSGPIADLVQLVPLSRLNALLVISPQSKYLDGISVWVDRLDKTFEEEEVRLFVYNVQHGRAADLANVLGKVFQSPSASTRSNDQRSSRRVAYEDEDRRVRSADSSESGIGIAGVGAIRITADEKNNALLVLASVSDYRSIEQALAKLDVVPLQVLLEAVIAEVTLTDDLRYGIQYYFEAGQNNTLTLSSSISSSIASQFPGFSYIFDNSSDIRVILDALSGITKVEVLSAPEIMVLNNHTAILQVGDQVPIATQESTSTSSGDAEIVNSIEYHDTGVILEVTPRVNRGGMVTMDVTQEVSDVSVTSTSTLNSPTIQQRKISTTVAVQSGQTIALGGLIKQDNTKSKSGIPLLKDIPLIGNLFRSSTDNKSRTELIVLITPHVVDSTERARAVTDELKLRLKNVQAILE